MPEERTFQALPKWHVWTVLDILPPARSRPDRLAGPRVGGCFLRSNRDTRPVATSFEPNDWLDYYRAGALDVPATA